jgi:hypothetical protein
MPQGNGVYVALQIHKWITQNKHKPYGAIKFVIIQTNTGISWFESKPRTIPVGILSEECCINS